MNNTEEKNNSILLPICVVILLILMPYLLTYVSGELCKFSTIFKDIYNNMDYEGIKTVMLSITFTTLGFAITLRNILIGRDRERHFGFSIKAIIRYSTKMYCKVCWYTVATVPFIEIFLYVRGYRRQLIFFTVLSAVCMVIYFLTVLQRIRKDVNNETVAYIFIDNIFNPNTVYSKVFRAELFQKLFYDISNFPEVNLVFDKVLSDIYTIVCKPGCLFFRAINATKSTVLQQSICKRLANMSSALITESIQSISLYSFDYYDMLRKSQLSLFSKDTMISDLSLFIDNTKFDVSSLAKSSIYLNCMNIEQKKKRTVRMTVSSNNAYYLFFNYILGMMCAGAYHLSLEDYKALTTSIVAKCEEKKVLLSSTMIEALSLMVLYYLEKNGSFERKKHDPKFYNNVLNYCNQLAKNTTEYDYKLLEEFLYNDFCVNNSKISFAEIYMIRKYEFKRGYGVFLNIIDS